METNNRVRNGFLAAALLMGLVCLPALAQVHSDMNVTPGGVDWAPRERHHSIVLTVSGGGYWERTVFEEGVRPFFEPYDNQGNLLPDGNYTWELRFLPRPEAIDSEAFQNARIEGDAVRHSRVPERVMDFGNIRIVGGSIVVPDSATEETSGAAQGGDRGETQGSNRGPGFPDNNGGGGQTRDQVILDDLIVDGSACVGFDCVNGESFGFDTIRLKENNLRIKFDDTSTSASFPDNDWQLTANASANGGADKFSIDDISGGRTPFTIEANAPSHSLYVDDGGRLGLSTSTPVAEIHIVDGDTPTLRLEQDGSSGFAPQTWDVAGNETNFFVRDATNGSQLPFKIRPSAPTNSLFVDTNGDIGLGTQSPDAVVDVERSADAGQPMMRLANNGRADFEYTNTDAGVTWTMSNNAAGIYAIDTGGGNAELRLQSDGDLLIQGNLQACFDTALPQCASQQNFPDYVFEDGYELMPLGELRAYIEREKHLPEMITREDVDKQRGINMTQLQFKLLEKIEELTLYTLAQESKIEALEKRLAEMQEPAEQ